ncbi:hypothetical protein AOCH_006190 [Aspergillus ochraceoroseus]|uniref:Diphosphomevalonate decarboxylase n=1 Tax=Aspergillus ochraceoroseus TaxID=138278 RepID=A0A0F8UYP1_9EURO|nr:hypothetical protein AOCH_006190 [Aspergillus ochraceoroseus]
MAATSEPPSFELPLLLLLTSPSLTQLPHRAFHNALAHDLLLYRYWGKRDATLNLPTNSSLSVTLSQRSLRTLTTASCSAAYPAVDELTLNGNPQDIQSSKRTLACLANLRALRQEIEKADSSLPKLSALPLRIVSENNFPTAAGLASSAAGFAALVRAVADLYQLPQSPTDLSRIARQGSGSACRSLMGGYVAWRAGELADGSDSLAEEVAPQSHWPEMRALILVVSAEKKDVPSTTGMQTTVATSELFSTRANAIVPARMTAIETAIQNRDFPTFAEITMRDSNGFHATCLDSWPPIFYMNDVSRAAVRLVHDINNLAGRTVCAYTFDAGPNAVIYYLEKDSSLVAGTFKAILGTALEGWSGPFYEPVKNITDSGVPLDQVDSRAVDVLKSGLSRVILTAVGEGPVSVQSHLVGEKGEILSSS